MKSISNQVSLLKNVPFPNKNILTTKTKKATRFNKRNLLLDKISPNSPYQQLYTSAKSSLFSDPSTFFSTSFEGKEVIIGKKASPYKIAPITNALTPLTRMARKSIYTGRVKKHRSGNASLWNRNRHLWGKLPPQLLCVLRWRQKPF
jgi:hypothetical protein